MLRLFIFLSWLSKYKFRERKKYQCLTYKCQTNIITFLRYQWFNSNVLSIESKKIFYLIHCQYVKIYDGEILAIVIYFYDHTCIFVIISHEIWISWRSWVRIYGSLLSRTYMTYVPTTGEGRILCKMCRYKMRAWIDDANVSKTLVYLYNIFL